MTIQKQPADIIWTYTDEAPALATHSSFYGGIDLKMADINVQMCDILVSGSYFVVLFPEHLSESQSELTKLQELGALVEHQ